MLGAEDDHGNASRSVSEIVPGVARAVLHEVVPLPQLDHLPPVEFEGDLAFEHDQEVDRRGVVNASAVVSGRTLDPLEFDRVTFQDWLVPTRQHVELDQANGTGGRTDWTNTDYNTGDAYDHFMVHFWYPGDVQATFSSHQLNGSFSDHSKSKT